MDKAAVEFGDSGGAPIDGETRRGSPGGEEVSNSDPHDYGSTRSAEGRGHMTSDSLQPIEPAEAIELYFSHRRSELAEKTIQNQRYRLNAFTEFCNENDIENLNQLTGRDLQRFRIWRQDGSDHYDPAKPVTLKHQLRTLQKFLEFAASIDAVPKGMREQVLIPDVDPEDEARDVLLEEERASTILDYLERFHYASREHVVVAILWHSKMRLGALRALDVDDVHTEDLDDGYIEVHHRPEAGTPLKNRRAGERFVAVGPTYCRMLDDYLEHHRHDVTDDYGRKPLITSSQGRLSEAGIREAVYQVTQPCFYSNECPHGKEPSSCEATQYGERAGCPSSRSPHGIRRGSITKHLRDGTPVEIVTERANVSKGVLDRHYDERSEREKMQLRRRFIDDA